MQFHSDAREEHGEAKALGALYQEGLQSRSPNSGGQGLELCKHADLG